MEAAINEAAKARLISTRALERELAEISATPGVGVLRAAVERLGYTTTDSDLERRFLRLVRRAGLPEPVTQAWLNGYRCDFHWPQFGLVVETDGLTYHRTAADQARDRRRDQAHTAVGLTQLRFANAQIRFEPAAVMATLTAVIDRLRG